MRRAVVVSSLVLALAVGVLAWLRLESGGGPGQAGVGGQPGSSSGGRWQELRASVDQLTRPGSGRPESATGSAPLEVPARVEDGQLEVAVVREGRPVAGAEVRLYWRGPTDPTTLRVDWRSAGAGSTGADGHLLLAARPGGYQVVARSPGSAPARAEVVRPHGEAVTRIRLELEPGHVLSGVARVKGSEDPVPLAQLMLIPALGSGFRIAGAPDEEKVVATADPRGSFRIEGLAAGEYQLDATAPTYGHSRVRALRIPRTEPLRVDFGGSGTVEGFVENADGSPAAGAQVVAVGEEVGESTSSGPKGGFSLMVEPGRYRLAAHLGALAGSSDPIGVAAGVTARGIILRLGKSAQITGVVTGKRDHLPVANATVQLSPYNSAGETGHAVTDASGLFSLGELAPGSYDVDVAAPAHTHLTLKGVTVTEGQTFPLQLELDGTGAVEGTVTDGRGHPLGAILVSGGSQWGGFLGSASAQVRTGPDGHYRLDALDVGPGSLTARRDGALVGKSEQVTVVEGQTAQVDFALPESATVDGRVLTRSGAPLSRAAVVTAMPESMRISMGELGRAEVTAEGTYQLALPAGTWRLSVGQADSGGPRRGELAVVVLEEGQRASQDLTLDDSPAASGAGITGWVLEPGGAPSPRALVALFSSDSRGTMMLTTDEQGHFDLGSAPAGGGPFTLKARAGGRQGLLGSLAADARDVTIQLQPGGAIRGTVVSAGGAPVKGFKAAAHVQQGPYDLPSFDDRGLQFTGDRFELGDVATGRVTVTVTTDSGRAGSAIADVVSGETAEVMVTLEPGGSAEGRVVDSGGRPVTESWLSLDGKPLFEEGASGSDGRFTLRELAPGTHQLRVMSGTGSATRSFTAVAGQTVLLGDIALSPPTAEPGTIGASFVTNGAQVMVGRLLSGGPAAQAGLKEGDRVLSVQGQPVASAAEANTLSRGDPLSLVTFSVERAGAVLSVEIQRAKLW